jgi:hypothetical protein
MYDAATTRPVKTYSLWVASRTPRSPPLVWTRQPHEQQEDGYKGPEGGLPR